MAHTLFETFEDSAVRVRPRNAAATAALVLGLLSLLLSVLTGVPALVAGLVGLVRSRSRGTGAVRSCVGVALGALSVAVLVVAVQVLLPAWSTVQSVRAVQAQGLPATDSPQVQAGLAEAAEVLQQVGVDPSTVDCGSPTPEGTSVVLGCTGQTLTGGAAEITASCPAAALVVGSATCEATVNGVPHEVRVALRDGVPRVEVL